MIVRVSLLLVLLGVVAGVQPAAVAGSRDARARPVTTVAIVGDRGLNPLHAEFRTHDGRDPAYPAGMPRPVRVPLPKARDFSSALAELREGPLGSPVPGTLYALSGTRVLFSVPAGTGDVLSEAEHGTGTASSAVGRTVGTSPDSLVVFVPDGGAASYDWVARQRWIDLASTSAYQIRTTQDQCDGASAVRALHRDGGLLFSSSGNTQDVFEPLAMPNGLPEVYQVGGVDRSGRTWLPPRPEEPELFFAVANVVRPYESGARFSFPAAAADSLTGTQPFGGTSGATPTVAGYAAELVAEARRLLGDRGPRTSTALARHRSGRRPPQGPLADGVFTRDELVEVLHLTAVPAETAPGRYALEGFGATDSRSHASAISVLRGTQKLVQRPDDQSWHNQAESLRGSQASRC